MLVASNVLACGAASDVTGLPTTTSDDAGTSLDAAAPDGAVGASPARRIGAGRHVTPTTGSTKPITSRGPVPLWNVVDSDGGSP